MVAPLQIISINLLQGALINQTHTRDFIQVVQQEREMRHRKVNSLNYLNPGSREIDDRVTTNHIILPN